VAHAHPHRRHLLKLTAFAAEYLLAPDVSGYQVRDLLGPRAYTHREATAILVPRSAGRTYPTSTGRMRSAAITCRG